ncbi:MAG: TonB-dependent receptor, partial [Bacteroidales bacterium]|nr:TonB-dependent receptor [Bacteroidales bacterium]
DGYTGVDIQQDDYLTIDTYARWHMDEHSTLQVNIDNLTDEKYITSLYEIGYYAAPRTYSLSYSYAF